MTSHKYWLSSLPDKVLPFMCLTFIDLTISHMNELKSISSLQKVLDL